MRYSSISDEARLSQDAYQPQEAPASCVQRVEETTTAGSLQSLVSTLVVLEHGRSDGILDVVADGVRTSIYMTRGIPAFAEEGTESATLTRLFVREGLLSREDYAHVVRRMTDTLFESEQMRFGEVAVQLGYLSVDQVHGTLAEESHRQILRCLGSATLSWRFLATQVPPELGCFPQSIRRLVLDTTRAMSPARRAALISASPTATLRLAGDVNELVGRFGMKPEEFRFALAIDGRRLADLRSMRVVGADADAVLAALEITGQLHVENADSGLLDLDEVGDMPTGIRMRTVPVVPSEAPSNVLSSPPSLASPSASSRSGTASVGMILPKRPASVEFSGLPGPEQANETRRLAARAFADGKSRLAANDMVQARLGFQRALVLYPHPVEYQLYARWAELHVVVQSRSEHDGLVHELRVLAERALREAVETEFAASVLSRLSA